MKLYDYQQTAVNTILQNFKSKTNVAVVLPTGSGKSVIISEVLYQLSLLRKRVLVLQPNVEILKQNRSTIRKHFTDNNQTVSIGVYSASVGSRKESDITLATIGSIVSSKTRDIKLQLIYDYILIDEAHLVNWADLSSKYRYLIDSLNITTIGLTATPYRMFTIGNPIPVSMNINPSKTGREYFADIEPVFKECIEIISVKELQERNLLVTPYYFDKFEGNDSDYMDLLQPNNPDKEVEMEYWYMRFFSKQMKSWAKSIIKLSENLNSVLVFCPNVESAKQLASIIPESFVLTGSTKKRKRAFEIDKFKKLKRRVVLNVGCLTTGFDYKGLDCIVILRPTKSYPLYIQMIGRALRTYEGKNTAYIVDYSGSLKYHGRIGLDRSLK